MPDTGTPAVLKRSIRGLQFFAHRPGEGVAGTEPMSDAHAAAQVAIVKHLRDAGYRAGVEQSGTTPDGERWQADVLCYVEGRVIAFEVQLAAQTLEDYETRSARYSLAGVECVWLVAAKRYMTLCKAITVRAWREETFRYGRRPSLAHVAAVPFEIGNEKQPDARAMRVAVFGELAPPGPPERVTLDVFVHGVIARRLRFCDEQWVWAGA